MTIKISLNIRKMLTILGLVSIIAILSCSQAFAADSSVNNGSWIVDNWPAIALVVSEVAAFLPTKVSGIVQGVVKGLSAVFSSLFGKNKS